MTLVERLAALFAGATEAHGTYVVTGTERADGKKKGTPKTVREPVTLALWEEHIAGGTGLGIIPIRSDSTASWGCIDVDTYPLDHAALLRQIDSLGLPLVVCRSKSGGAHLFIFVTEPVPAGDIREALRRIAAGIGRAGCEIFPKQSEILSTRGDLGNWLNMPYHDAERTTRYGLWLSVKNEAASLPLDTFLDYAEQRRVTPAELSAIAVRADQDTVEDGPPCLEHLVAEGFPSGTRNNGLQQLGVYFKKAFPDSWEQKLEEFNRTRMNPPKSSAEMQGMIRGLQKKDYGFRCSEPPLNQHCNRQLCVTRKFGVNVGGGLVLPNLGSLTKQDSCPPIWFLEVEGHRIELTSEDLLSQSRLQRAVMERCNILIPKVKDQVWQETIRGLLESVTIIEAPKDASIHGVFDDLLETFCVNQYAARSREEILLDKAWTDEGTTYFRMSALRKFLTQQKFTDYDPPKIMARLRDLGGRSQAMNFGGKNRSVWAIPAFDTPTVPPEPSPNADAF